MDLADLALNNQSTVSIKGITFFKKSVDRCLQTPSKSSFILASQALQLAIVPISAAQTMANWAGALNSDLTPAIDNPIYSARLQLLFSTLIFCTDAMENVISQISRMSLISVHMCRIFRT